MWATDDGSMALLMASQEGRVGMAKALAAAGANAGQGATSDGLAPPLIASQEGSAQVARALAAVGASAGQALNRLALSRRRGSSDQSCPRRHTPATLRGFLCRDT